MASIIEVQSQALNSALAQLVYRIGHAGAALGPIGQDMAERAKRRFVTATGPDGARWAANAQSTLMNYIKSKSGFSRKTGKILSKGRALAMAKRPLQGVSGDLARQLFYQVDDDSMTFGSSMIYAAMQQFGGSKSRFGHLWGDIPARPFLPITPQGTLYPADEELVIDQLSQYLLG